MKKVFPLFLILILMLSCKKNSAIKSHNLEFQLLTDTTIQTYEDNAFKKVFSYPQKQVNQEGPNIELLESKIEANHITLIYDFQQYGFERAAGFGTITIEVNQQDEKYYLSKFEYDVNGHFRVVDEEDDIWVPDQNGDKLVPRDIKAEDFFKHFSFTNLNYKK